MNLFEVFEELQVKKELENAFLKVEVVKIVTSRSTGDTIIYLRSKQLLENSTVMMMQKEIFKQFFGKLGRTVRLSVEYDLSSQYTVASLWDLHKENLIEVIKHFKEPASRSRAAKKMKHFIGLLYPELANVNWEQEVDKLLG